MKKASLGNSTGGEDPGRVIVRNAATAPLQTFTEEENGRAWCKREEFQKGDRGK